MIASPDTCADDFHDVTCSAPSRMHSAKPQFARSGNDLQANRARHRRGSGQPARRNGTHRRRNKRNGL